MKYTVSYVKRGVPQVLIVETSKPNPNKAIENYMYHDGAEGVYGIRETVSGDVRPGMPVVRI